MAGRKLHHFVCFAVTMGLVACDSGNLNSSPDATSGDTTLQNGAESATKSTPPVSSTVSTVHSTTTKLAPTSRFTSSGPAPSSASTPSVHTAVPPKSKSCPTAAQPAGGTHQKALFLIIAGALLFTCVVLLVTVTALACKVSHLRGRLSGSRSAPINGAGLWAPGREGGDVAGAGVAETSVMLEEVTPVQNKEEATAAADEAGPAEEADRGPTAAAAAKPEPEPEPAPAADPDPVESPKTPTADKA
ncbi:uncharacterized protein LOC135262783 [Anguilla rostrata]|uniref:uncharacterized protein LOC135262783 n=1 Tax=Anguilla rostrata TaxID=7938 RepID=UPI0030D61EBF